MSNLHANFITSGKAGLWSKLQPVYLYKSKKKLGRELKLITKNLKPPTVLEVNKLSQGNGLTRGRSVSMIGLISVRSL